MKVKDKQSFWDMYSEKWKGKWMEREAWQVKERKGFALKVGKGTILDLGCGGGRDRELFEKEGLSYVGIDFSKEMLKGQESNFICGSATILPLQDKSLDGVWCCSLIKHLERKELQELILEVERILISRGYVWICFDEGEGIIKEMRNGIKISLTLYTKKEILDHLQPKFQVIKIERRKKWRNFISVLAQKVK